MAAFLSSFTRIEFSWLQNRHWKVVDSASFCEALALLLVVHGGAAHAVRRLRDVVTFFGCAGFFAAFLRFPISAVIGKSERVNER